MAATTTSHQHHLFNHPHAATATAPPPDHLNMLTLHDVVFISPPPPLHHQPPPPPAAAVGLGVSIFPLLPCLPSTTATNPSAAATLDFQVQPHFQTNQNDRRNDDDDTASHVWSFSRKQDAFLGDRQDDTDLAIIGGGTKGAMMRVCRDCGNRAKKECMHRRCRTCCKSRGYDCPTHVKSTWIPAARRRVRQQQGQGTAPIQNQEFVAGSSSSFSSGVVKRPRLGNTSTTGSLHNNNNNNGSSASNAPTPRSFDTISCRQDASFKQSLPGKVRAPAVFRCIRVTAISDNAAEFAYQATVTISGHVFKGFLYDQGMDGKNVISCISELQFDEVAATGVRSRDDSSPMVDPAFLASGCRRLLGGEN